MRNNLGDPQYTERTTEWQALAIEYYVVIHVRLTPRQDVADAGEPLPAASGVARNETYMTWTWTTWFLSLKSATVDCSVGLLLRTHSPSQPQMKQYNFGLQQCQPFIDLRA